MNTKEKGIILFSLLMLSQLFLLGSIILKPTEANGQLGQTEDNNNNLYNHDQFGINDIILPKSSSLPSFTWNTITDNKISSYELTTLAVYDFLPNANCPDILIGTANDGFYLFVGQQYPFTSFAWATSFALNTSVASPIKALYPMHIGGIHQTTTEIYVGNGQGNQFYFRHNNYARSRYSQLTYWENTSKEDQSAGYIYGHSITSSIQVELGGSYDINDEIVVGLDNGNLVQVVTESVDYGTVASKYSEYLVSNAFSNSVDDIVAGDVDLDGDIDLVTSFSGGSTYTFGNDGTPRVGTWGSQLTTSTPGVLALGDLDIDGYPDLVLGSSTGYIYVYRNTGNMLSSSLTAVTKASLSVGVNDIAAADLDNDGDLDIVAALNNGTIILLENPEHVPVGDTRVDPFQTGSSGYWNQEVLTDQTGAVNKIKIVDMDNDGDLDIVAIYSDGWARIYQNNLDHVSTSKFRFGPAETIETNTINNLEDNKIAIGDLDNDGFDDLVVGSLSSSTDTNATIKIFKNPGYDTFVNFDLVNTWNSYVIYSWRNAKIYGIDIKDIDHDGDNDILFIENKTCVRALKNDGTPWQTYWQGNIPTTLLDATANSLTGNTILLVDDLDYDWKNEIFWLSTEIGTNQGNITAFRQQSDPWLSWNDRVNISGNPFNNDPVVGAVIDYFDNDNFRDLIYYDNSHIVAKQGTSNINAMYNLNSYTSLYNASSNTIISLTNIEYSGDKSADLIFSLTTNDLALKGLRNQPSNTPGFNNPWNEDYRAPSDYQIIGSATGDLNNDGKSDAIIWNSTSFWACQGNNDINFNWTKYFIDTISEGIRDLKIKDIDHDGDLDIIISTKDHVYYYPNRFRDDVNPPDLTININPLYSADTVVINASSNESLYSSPWIKIFDGVTTTYAQMTPTGAPLTWTYTYHVVRNGTHYVTINGTDLYGNVGESTDVFYGDKILPDLHISIQGTLISGFSNHSVTITITNTTDVVGDNKVFLNITHPTKGTTYYTLDYNESIHAWRMVYSGVDTSGVYFVRANASDQYFVDYSYAEANFTGDIEFPQSTITAPNPNNNSQYLTNQNLPFKANFSEPIIRLGWELWKDGILSAKGDFYDIDNVNGQTSVDLTYSLPLGTKGNVTIRFVYVDRAGNYNYSSIEIYITVWPPSFVSFYFKDSATGQEYISNVTIPYVTLILDAINCTKFRVKVDDGEWSQEYSFKRGMAYEVSLPDQSGNYTITVRFENSDDYVDLSHTIEYIKQVPPQFPWVYLVLGVLAVAFAFALVAIIKKGRSGKSSYKEFLDDEEW